VLTRCACKTATAPPRSSSKASVVVCLSAAAALVAAQPALADSGEVPVSQLGSAWDPAPPVVLGAGLALLLFMQAFVRLRRRGRADHADWSRPALFLLAVSIGMLALVSPLDAVGDSYLLSGHMLQHVLIGDAAPALALVALRGPLLFFLLPYLCCDHSPDCRGCVGYWRSWSVRQSASPSGSS
jgi:hypothetical protein